MPQDSNFAWPEGIKIPKGFFAYPSNPPSIPATIAAAIQSINRSQATQITAWENINVSGHYVIDQICQKIDESEFFCADVTGINPNVMFELGYAIATDKRVWLVRDESYIDTKKEFDQLRVLTTVGFRPYTNSDQLIKGLVADRPQETLEDTIWKNSIEPVLVKQTIDKSVLYLKNQHETEASIKVTRSLEDSRVPMTISDPRESSVRPAYWYAQHLWDSPGLVVHFSSSVREGFRLHNARYALIAGMAIGFNVPTLMLSEQGDLLAPIDYRDLLKTYLTPKQAADLVDEWLGPITRQVTVLKDVVANRARVLRLATELKDFHVQLGDYIAEDESNHLNEYFVETTVSADIINGTQNVFVGRKGTGKSANLIHAEAVIGSDIQNLVCLIRPVGYEIEGLLRLFSKYQLQDFKGYAIESLWKFMIYSELARAAVKQIEEAELWRMTEPDASELVRLLEDEKQAFGGDFAVRLERVVKTLELAPTVDSHEAFRKGISEGLHSGALAKMRLVLGRVLGQKRQVILLIDNLDKTWTKDADLPQLAQFLLGLLTATNRVGEELNRSERDRPPTNFSSAIFLRSDIFERVLAVAREPDKLSFTRLKWDDDELLVRIIEERYVTSHGENSDPADMWRKYFTAQVRGIPTRQYITTRILKRPRDIVYLVKAAVSFAVNRKRDRVEEKDILDAEKEYGQYALDSILVENVSIVPNLEDVLFRFSGSNSTITDAETKQIVSKAEVPTEQVDHVIGHLVRLSFLGLEVRPDEFAFSEEVRELKQNIVLAERFGSTSSNPTRFQIHPAFRAYLRITE